MVGGVFVNYFGRIGRVGLNALKGEARETGADY